jgi:hypothetical protein
MRRWLAPVCFALAGACASAPKIQVQQRAVSIDLAEVEKSFTVSEVARAFARGRSAAGFVVSRRDLQASGPARRTSSTAISPTPLPDVVRAFRSRYPGIKVEDRPNGTLFFTLPDTRCVAALNRPLSNVKLSGTVYGVGFDLLRSANPAIENVPPAILGSGLQPNGSFLTVREVSVVSPRLTLHEALDEIIRQVPGLVWLMLEDVDRRDALPGCYLTWMSALETVDSPYDFLQLRVRFNS